MIFCLFSLILSAAAYGGQSSRIQLNDGSSINGEVIGMANGVYVVETSAFGTMHIPSEKIAKIEAAQQNASPVTGMPLVSGKDPAAAQVTAYGQTLLQNPENAALVGRLTKDPVMQEMAKDPELQAAAKNGDIAALMKNPKFMDLVNSPEVQETVKELKK